MKTIRWVRTIRWKIDFHRISFYFYLDLKKLEHRYESVSRVLEEFHLKANGVLIAGDVAEENFIKKWHGKVKK